MCVCEGGGIDEFHLRRRWGAAMCCKKKPCSTGPKHRTPAPWLLSTAKHGEVHVRRQVHLWRWASRRRGRVGDWRAGGGGRGVETRFFRSKDDPDIHGPASRKKS